MSLRTKLFYSLLVIVAASALIVFVLWRSDRRSLEVLAKRRDEVCQRMEWDLQAIIAARPPNARRDLQVRMQTHFLDQGLMQLCFGNPIVVETDAADACSIMRDDADACFLKVARALLDAFRARNREAR